MTREHPAVELAAQLVRINSENPDRLEGEVVAFIADWLSAAGLDFSLQPVAPGRQNILARVPGRGKRSPLALLAHCDTVPAGQGWSFDPFAGTVEGGRLLGRGSSDMKGGLAAALQAMKEVRDSGPPPGDLLVAVTVDEEGGGMMGAAALIESGAVDAGTMIVAPEPTSLEIVRAHRGVIWYEILAHGVMAHGGHAERGVDANHALAEVICELKTAAAALPFVDPLVGGALLSIGKIAGGTKTNVVPNMARAEVDFRIPPPFVAETANAFIGRAAQRAIGRVRGASVEVRNLGLARPPVETPADAPVVARLEAACRQVLGSVPSAGGYAAYTDAAMVSIALDNRNAALFGPGDLRLAHAVDEWASTDEIARCTEVFKALALGQ